MKPKTCPKCGSERFCLDWEEGMRDSRYHCSDCKTWVHPDDYVNPEYRKEEKKDED